MHQSGAVLETLVSILCFACSFFLSLICLFPSSHPLRSNSSLQFCFTLFIPAAIHTHTHWQEDHLESHHTLTSNHSGLHSSLLHFISLESQHVNKGQRRRLHQNKMGTATHRLPLGEFICYMITWHSLFNWMQDSWLHQEFKSNNPLFPQFLFTVSNALIGHQCFVRCTWGMKSRLENAAHN